MRKSIALKTLFRSPLKAILTFLLLAAASFALFSRITDYEITIREIANAESFCRGVAALDNTVSEIFLQGSGSGMVSDYAFYELDDRLWPTDEQIAEFSSLPGVTLADTRYMTAGLVEDYKRLDDEGSSVSRFVIEGTYIGCDYTPDTTGVIKLSFEDMKVIASDEAGLDIGKPIEAIGVDDQTYYDNPYPAEFFENLEKGSRCLILGDYNDIHSSLRMGMGEEAFQVLDGLGDNYLDTEAFDYQKGVVEAIRQSVYTYDIVYTEDMRAIPRFNEHNMVISQGRTLVTEDTDACVVNELFLEEYGLSIGDKVKIQLGDRLCHQGSGMGARARDAGSVSKFVSTVDLEIIGAYKNVDDNWMRSLEIGWSYSNNAVFVPKTLLSVKVPEDYEVSMGEFSVLVENAHDIEAFQQAAESLAAEIGIPMRFSDGGWLSMKDSFQAGRRAAILTTLLSVAGTALALFLAVYLYIGRNKKSYAIMRTLGLPANEARDLVTLPFFVLSVLAIPIGGIAGLFYTSKTAQYALMEMASDALPGYVPDAAFSPGTAILCLLLELAFILSITLGFLWNMKRMPPLELLQGNLARTGTDATAAPELTGSASALAGIDIGKISASGKAEISSGRKYGVLRHVSSYILRHMRRGLGKTAVSLSLTVVLTAGVGTFVLARLTYQDAAREMDVKGRALMFSSAYIPDLQKSDLINDFYCYDNFKVHINKTGISVPMTFTNDIDRYLAGGGCSVSYAPGYDSSSMNESQSLALCLMGHTLAEKLGVSLGDRVFLLSDNVYTVMTEAYKDEEELDRRASLKARGYTVAGIISSDIAGAGNGIFAAANRVMQDIYNPPFSFQFKYCEFTLADNERLDELNSLLDEMKMLGKMDAPTASYYIDTTGLQNVRRICGLLDSLFPVVVAAAILTGLFGPGLVIMQSSREAAYLRVLGVTKKCVQCMLVFEQAVLCAAGIMLVVGALVLYSSDMFARGAKTLAACWILYFLGCFLGTSMAAILVTRHRLLELLQAKE